MKKSETKSQTQPRKSYTYTVFATFNGTEKKIKTDNVSETILSLKPTMLKTKVCLKIKRKDKKIAEKVLNPFVARRLWKLPVSFKALIDRLIYK